MEDGYDASGKEIVPPEYSISSISSDNPFVIVTFTEQVTTTEDLTSANIEVEIDGSSSPYSFDWKVESGPEVGESFDNLVVKVTGISVSMLGSETLKFKLTSPQNVKDLAGNEIVDA